MSIKNEYCDSKIKYVYTYSNKLEKNVFGLHTHTDYEIYIFISGKGKYTVEGTEYNLRPGTTLIFRSGEAHVPQIDSNAPYERIAINFTSEFLNEIDPDSKLLTPFLERPLGRMNCYNNLSSIKRVIELSQTEFESEYLKRLFLYNAVNNILLEIYLNFGEHKENIGAQGESEFISQMLEYVNVNLFDVISLDVIAKNFFISKSQLNRYFKKYTGSTAWGYITAKRLLNARKLILDGVAAKTACLSSGFEDYSSFFRAYKKRFGVSPSDDKKH